MQTIDLNKKDELRVAMPVNKNSDKLASIEEKLDLVLKYQKSVRRIAIFRGIISFIFFVVFIILPIIGSVYFVKYINQKVDFTKISSQYKDFYQTIDSVKKSGASIKNVEEAIKKSGVIK